MKLIFVSCIWALWFGILPDTGKRVAEPPGYLVRAVAAEGRPDADRQRDIYRKPADVLYFFGIEPGQRVAELMTGTGYYLDILSRVVGERGMVYGQNTQRVIDGLVKDRLDRRLENPELANAVPLVANLEEPGLPKDLDAVLMVLFYHDTVWQGVDRAKMNRAVFDALKPGGIYGIVDHRAEPGSGDRDVKTLHRIDSDVVLREILDAGFVLEGISDLLANPEDTHDYPFFKDLKTTRDRTDRFVFRFRKPAVD